MSNIKEARADIPVRVKVNIKDARRGASSVLCLCFSEGDGKIEFLVVEKSTEKPCFFLPGGRRKQFQWKDDSGVLPETEIESFLKTGRRETREEALLSIPEKRLFHTPKVKKNIEGEAFIHRFYVTFLRDGENFLPPVLDGAGDDIKNRLWVSAEYAVMGELKKQPNMMTQYQMEFHQGIHLTEALGKMFEELNRVRDHKRKHPLFEWIISHEGDRDFDRELGYLRDAVLEMRPQNQIKLKEVKLRENEARDR